MCLPYQQDPENQQTQVLLIIVCLFEKLVVLRDIWVLCKNQKPWRKYNIYIKVCQGLSTPAHITFFDIEYKVCKFLVLLGGKIMNYSIVVMACATKDLVHTQQYDPTLR